MRKAHMHIVIDGLKKQIADLEHQRDEARDTVREGLTRLHGTADAHTAALAKLSDDVSGLAESVRAAIMPPAAPAAEASETPAVKAPAEAVPAVARKAGAPGRNGKTPAAP